MRSFRKPYILLLLFAVVGPMVFLGCPNGIEPLLPLTSHEVRATISDYGTFDSKDASVALDQSGYIIRAPIPGSSGQDTLVMTVVLPVQSPVPYTVDLSSDPNARISYCVQQISGSCVDYDAFKGQGSGAITLSSVTDNGSSKTLEGTFSAVVVAPNGDSKRITNGEFKVVYP